MPDVRTDIFARDPAGNLTRIGEASGYTGIKPTRPFGGQGAEYQIHLHNWKPVGRSPNDDGTPLTSGERKDYLELLAALVYMLGGSVVVSDAEVLSARKLDIQADRQEDMLFIRAEEKK